MEHNYTLTHGYLHDHALPIKPLIPYNPLSHAVVMIDFDQTCYDVSEEMTVVAEVRVLSGITLDRDVVVTVETAEGFGTNGAGI